MKCLPKLPTTLSQTTVFIHHNHTRSFSSGIHVVLSAYRIVSRLFKLWFQLAQSFLSFCEIFSLHLWNILIKMFCKLFVEKIVSDAILWSFLSDLEFLHFAWFYHKTYLLLVNDTKSTLFSRRCFQSFQRQRLKYIWDKSRLGCWINFATWCKWRTNVWSYMHVLSLSITTCRVSFTHSLSHFDHTIKLFYQQNTFWVKWAVWETSVVGEKPCRPLFVIF